MIKNKIQNLSTLSCILENEDDDIVNTLNDHIIVGITNSKGIITYVNKKFCEISKYSKYELLGKNHQILKSDYHTHDFYKNLWNIISSGKTWQENVKNRAKDGTFYWVKTTITPCFNNQGKIYQYISIRTDITKEIELSEKLKKTETLLKQHNENLDDQVRKMEILEKERLTVVGRLASRVSHDIRNPLQVINNSFEMLRLNNPDLDNIFYEKIERSIDRITHQINDVFEHVSIKRPHMEKCFIGDIVNRSISQIKIPNTIDLEKNIQNCELECDPEEIEIALINLLKNSLNAMPKTGMISVDVKDCTDHIVITVTDTGCGIDHDDIHKVFDILFTTYQKGTGLGLTCCKSIVEEHNGKISVNSEKDIGTVFKITLPKIQSSIRLT